MKLKESIFKAYDIRGIYNKDFDNEFAYKLGQAFANFILKEKGNNKVTIAVSRDMRLSSPELATAVIKGISSQGVEVADLGMLSTPSFYFAVDKYDFAAGIQVSASHNPAEYNGFKLVRENAIPISGDTGIHEIKKKMLNKIFVEKEDKGQVNQEDEQKIIQEDIDSALELVSAANLKPFKIVVDAANSMGAPLFEKFFEKLPCELIELNFELDGTFPSHEADPLKEENNQQLQEQVIETGADLGIALDGDADRIFFVDNEGKTVEPAIIRGLLSQFFLKQNPGAKICYDIRPGKITEDMICEAGGEPVVTRVGHSLIKEKMREVDAVFAGESSGHFFLKVDNGYYERPLVMTLAILKMLSCSNKTFAEFVKPLYKYSHSGEINFEVPDKQAVFDRLQEKYSANLKYDFDGVSYEWPDWWFNVRPSNTENKVRLNLEAVDKETMEKRRDDVIAVINPKS